MQNSLHTAVKSVMLGSLLAASGAATQAVADEDIYPRVSGPSIGVYGGYLYIDNDVDLDPTTMLGLNLGYRFHSDWEIELRHQVGEADYKYGPGEVELTQAFFNVLYHLQLGKNVQPYWMLGLGHQNIDAQGYYFDANSTLFDAGLGLKWAINDKWSVRSDLVYINDLKFELSHAQLNLGIHYQFGQADTMPKPAPKPVSTDDDKDGVPNQFDRCPGTKMGVTVDANGCEIVLDDDKDGVPNSKDKCPNTAAGAKVDSDGCYIIITDTKTIACLGKAKLCGLI